MDAPVLTERRDGVLLLTLNRPRRLNALDWEALRALEMHLAIAAEESVVQCVVLTGAGERAFCAGADLACVAALTRETAGEWIRLGHRICNALVRLPKPTIAAVRGYALGGGLELALACDFRVLADDATLGLPEVTRGWTPGWGGARRLQALVGPGRARQVALAGEQLNAATATAWGLAADVAPARELPDRALEIATRLAAQDEAVRRAKAMLLTGTPEGLGPAGLLCDEAAVERDVADLVWFTERRGERAHAGAEPRPRRWGVQ